MVRWAALSIMLLGLAVVAGCGGASEEDVRVLEQRVDELEQRVDEVEAGAANDYAVVLELLEGVVADIPIDEELGARREQAADLVETACSSAVDRLGETVAGPIREACERALDALRDGESSGEE